MSPPSTRRLNHRLHAGNLCRIPPHFADFRPLFPAFLPNSLAVAAILIMQQGDRVNCLGSEGTKKPRTHGAWISERVGAGDGIRTRALLLGKHPGIHPRRQLVTSAVDVRLCRMCRRVEIGRVNCLMICVCAA